jgi:hypothetical protein
MEKDEASESEGDEDDWVTCDNIQNHITGLEHISKDDAVDENILGVAVLTADYAMQVMFFIDLECIASTRCTDYIVRGLSCFAGSKIHSRVSYMQAAYQRLK